MGIRLTPFNKPMRRNHRHPVKFQAFGVFGNWIRSHIRAMDFVSTNGKERFRAVLDLGCFP